jgi:hypothetical protein
MCMGGYSIRLEGLEDPGFCSHLGVRMADGRNGLRATAANTTTTPSGKSPSGRCPRGFRLPRSHRTRMTERGGVSGVFAGWIFRQLSSTATAKHWQPAQASVVSIAGDTITTSLPLASQMSSRAASAASKASLSDHHGRVDDSNGIFYCFECWALFEDWADYAGGAALAVDAWHHGSSSQCKAPPPPVVNAESWTVCWTYRAEYRSSRGNCAIRQYAAAVPCPLQLEPHGSTFTLPKAGTEERETGSRSTHNEGGLQVAFIHEPLLTVGL